MNSQRTNLSQLLSPPRAIARSSERQRRSSCPLSLRERAGVRGNYQRLALLIEGFSGFPSPQPSPGGRGGRKSVAVAPTAGALAPTAVALAPTAHGFTLLELVVAMMMVAILAGSLFVSMQEAYKAQQSSEEAMEPTRTAELAMEFLRNDLQNALPPHDPQSYTSQYQKLAGNFEGSNGGGPGGGDGDVTFFSTAEMKDHPSANGDIKEIELTIDTPAGTKQRCLVRKCLRNLLTDPLPPPDEEIICRGVNAFTVRFFDGSSWNDVWDSTQENNELPAAIEITLVLDRPTAQQQRLLKYVRVFQMPCSNVLFDSQVNGGLLQ